MTPLGGVYSLKALGGDVAKGDETRAGERRIKEIQSALAGRRSFLGGCRSGIRNNGGANSGSGASSSVVVKTA
jgi:hypothetical protein